MLPSLLRTACLALAGLFAASPAWAVTPPAPRSLVNPEGAEARLVLDAELGFLGVLGHRVQFGRQGTEIDYVEEGGQNVLFPLTRWQAALDVGDRHSILLLYQPLDLRTRASTDREWRVDGAEFPAGTPMELRYGFSFWRAGWLYDLAAAPRQELALGAGLQIRNADIFFADTAGTTLRNERDIGPVPLLAGRWRSPLGDGFFLGAEASGIYAPIKYLNGSNTDVVGSLLDASTRAGLRLDNGAEVYLNLRYLGGGAEGTSKDPDGPGDGYTENWLHFLTLSLGAGLR